MNAQDFNLLTIEDAGLWLGQMMPRGFTFTIDPDEEDPQLVEIGVRQTIWIDQEISVSHYLFVRSDELTLDYLLGSVPQAIAFLSARMAKKVYT